MKRVALTGLALLGLFGLSLGLSYVDFGAASLTIALAIAGLKAFIVAWSFMELARAALSIRLAVAAAAVLVAVLIGFIVTDLEMRSPPAAVWDSK